MSRVVDWPERLYGTVEFWRSVPFAWGASDCLGFALACVKAVRGAIPVDRLPAYADAKEARRALRNLGHGGLAAALGAHFDPIPVSLAQRGDLGVLVHPDGSQTAMVCLGGAWAGKTEDGILQVHRSVIAEAFRV